MSKKLNIALKWLATTGKILVVIAEAGMKVNKLIAC